MLILFLQATAEVRNALKNVTCTYGFSEASSFDCGPPFIFVQMMTVGSFAFLVDANSDARCYLSIPAFYWFDRRNGINFVYLGSVLLCLIAII